MRYIVVFSLQGKIHIFFNIWVAHYKCLLYCFTSVYFINVVVISFHVEFKWISVQQNGGCLFLLNAACVEVYIFFYIPGSEKKSRVRRRTTTMTCKRFLPEGCWLMATLTRSISALVSRISPLLASSVYRPTRKKQHVCQRVCYNDWDHRTHLKLLTSKGFVYIGDGIYRLFHQVPSSCSMFARVFPVAVQTREISRQIKKNTC